MNAYLNFLNHILTHGEKRHDRTGVGTVSVFGHDMRFKLDKSAFPVITTKKIFLKGIVSELLYFISGETNIQSMIDDGVIKVWKPWSDVWVEQQRAQKNRVRENDVGKIYGYQWRHWTNPQGREFDQLRNLLTDLRQNPHSRRHIISAWNPGEISEMALPPCHCFMQFYVDSHHRLSCKLTQRSADAFIGVPFNITSYALLTALIAQECDLGLGELIWSGGDCHIYLDHIDAVQTQLARQPKPLPQLKLANRSIFDMRLEDIVFENYDCHPLIKANVAV